MAVAKWRDLFLAGGQRALEAGARRGLSGREQQLAVEIEELNTALGEAHMELRLWKKGGLAALGFDDLEAERAKADVTVTTFCAVTGIGRATWYRWRAASSSSMGPWSTPAQDTVEADAKALAAAWPDGGTASSPH